MGRSGSTPPIFALVIATACVSTEGSMEIEPHDATETAFGSSSGDPEATSPGSTAEGSTSPATTDLPDTDAETSAASETDSSATSGGTGTTGSPPATTGPNSDCEVSCGAGGVCNDNACSCFGSLSPCDGVCTDLAADPQNCGGCGVDCEGDVCRVGDCEDACDGETPDTCDGWCTDIQTDIFNCGACGESCSETAVCVAGECRSFDVTMCDACPCDGCENLCCDGGYFGGLVTCVEAAACPV